MTKTITYTTDFLLRENHKLRTELMSKNEKIAELNSKIEQLSSNTNG